MKSDFLMKMKDLKSPRLMTLVVCLLLFVGYADSQITVRPPFSKTKRVSQEEALAVVKTLYEGKDVDYYVEVFQVKIDTTIVPIIKPQFVNLDVWTFFVDEEPMEDWDHPCALVVLPRNIYYMGATPPAVKIDTVINCVRPPANRTFESVEVKNRCIPIVYEDNCDFSNTHLVFSRDIKRRRLSSKGHGMLSIKTNDSLPEFIKDAVNSAFGIWAPYMAPNDSLVLNVEYNNSNGCDVYTEVFCTLDNSEGYFYPNSLLRHKKQLEDPEKKKDASIIINSETEWVDGYGKDDSHPKKLVPALIQSLGKALGYGSSIKKVGGRLSFFYGQNKNIFDKYVFSEDGQRLESVKKANEIAIFAQQDCGYLYVGRKDDQHKIYAPKTFDKQKSLCTSCDPSSVMYHGDGGDRDFMLDEGTAQILSMIGWNSTPKSIFTIKCDEIDNTGITSGYKKHKFYIDSGGAAVTNPHWTLKLPLLEGGYEVTQELDRATFTTNEIKNADKYRQTVDGDINGMITFRGMVGEELDSAFYNVTFELKPLIDGVNVVSTTPCEDDSTYYDVAVEVNYRGSYYVHAYLEEEGSPVAKSAFSDSPLQSLLSFKAVDSWANAKVTVVVENDYGSVTYVKPISFQREGKSKVKSRSRHNLTINGVDVITPEAKYVYDDGRNPLWTVFVQTKAGPVLMGGEHYTIYTKGSGPVVIDAHQEFDWSQAVPCYQSNLGRYVYRGYISGMYPESGGETPVGGVNGTVYFDVIPNKPVFYRISLYNQTFDFSTMQFVNPLFSIGFDRWFLTQKITKGFLYHQKEGGEKDSIPFDIVDMGGAIPPGFSVRWFDWNCSLWVTVGNDYGYSVASDTLSTLSLLDDLLDDDFVRDCLYWTAKVEDHRADHGFSYHGGVVMLAGEAHRIRVLNAKGVVILTEQNTNQVDLNALPKGMYIIEIVDKGKHKEIKKIVR